MWNTNVPPAVVVSIASVSERKPMPRSPTAPTASISCLGERAGRA